MMWDPTLDSSELIDDFLTGYYQSAGQHVRTYMEVMHASVNATQYYMHESFDAVHAPFMTPAAVLAGASAFATALAEPLPAEVHNRVLSSAMAIYWVAMPRWGELQAYAVANGIPWPLEKSLAEAFDTTFSQAFNITAARYGALPSFREGQPGNLSALRHELIGSCPDGWVDSPCAPLCPSGDTAVQWFPVGATASQSWKTPPTVTGGWNSGGYAPQWLEFTVNASAGHLAGVVGFVSMVPAGNATHIVEVDGQQVTTWSGPMQSDMQLRYKAIVPIAAKTVRVTTTASPSWVSWASINLYFCTP